MVTLSFYSTNLEARLSQKPSVEELRRLSSIVLQGTVTRIEHTDGKGSKKLPGADPLPANEIRATIHVDVLEKGSAPPDLVFHYLNVEPGVLTRNGPIEIHLETGKRYRFYLKSVGKHHGEFVPVLQGQFDDGWAVETVETSKAN